ncbi:substrate-binding domain-containing protein [Streptomyces cupreus]|uniref:Substrate-binding domain-containing protein n=1 Tax=Streptomyces cupreus TaxID=2759956 RepID=A0A7X1J1T3_9ACTN|nr:substrate-binding domain-containing protein [Streptomyces cupreus]MBC2902551.1 substrate-binding domain-containing protein [Streptomyces cupreus]
MIFTALPVEYEKVERHLKAAGATRSGPDELDGGTRAAVYELSGRVPWRVYLAKTGTGNTTTATAVSSWLAKVQPEAAFFVGIAAGRKDAVPRDVVISETVYEYQRGKQSEQGFHARPRSWEPPGEVLSTAEQVADELTPLITGSIHVKPIASGDTVIDSPYAPEHRIIRTHYEDTAAIETEGAGFARAVQSRASTGLKWLLIRGISDLADGDKKGLEAADGQKDAALNAAHVAVRILLALDIEPSAQPARSTATLSLRMPRKPGRPPVEPRAKGDPGPPPRRRPTVSGPGRRRLLWGVPLIATATILAVVAAQSFGGGDSGDDDKPPAASLPRCGKADTELHIAASVDKSESLRRAAEHYGHRSDGGTCVEVVIDDKNSGEAMRALTRGWGENDGPLPDVWSPAGGAWLSLARTNAKDETRGLFPEQAEPIVTSPLTIAMPRPMAEVLEWPENRFSWSELAGWSRNAKGFWGKKNRGKPDWGDFKLGKTNPEYSTSGLNATIGAFYAATGTSGELSKGRLDDSGNRAFVKDIEQSAVHYGDTTLTFTANLRRADEQNKDKAMSYISAVTLEESTVAAYNAGYPCGALSQEKVCEKTTKPETPLVSFYPTDGILFSDHPYIKLNNGMDEAKEAVADDFLTYLHAPETFARDFAPFGFRTHEGAVPKNSPLLTEANGVKPDTELDPLSTPQDDVLKHLLDIWPALRRPANVLLVIDTSGSMNDEITGTGDSKLQRLKQAETELLGEFTGSDKVGLWKFSDAEDLGGGADYRELVPLGPYHGASSKLMSENFRALEAEGATGLYDTLDAATEAMRDKYDPRAINAIVLLTDGRNEDRGSLTEEELLRHIRDTSQPQVRVFTIAYGSKADDRDKGGRSVLQRIADAGGGKMYDARNAETIEKVITSVISNF